MTAKKKLSKKNSKSSKERVVVKKKSIKKPIKKKQISQKIIKKKIPCLKPVTKKKTTKNNPRKVGTARKVVKSSDKEKILNSNVPKKDLPQISDNEKAIESPSKNIKNLPSVPILSSNEKRDLKITESKIKKLLDINHLEELLHVISILNSNQLEVFISHYKSKAFPNSKDKKVDLLINNSKSSKDLLLNVKNELISELEDEHINLKSDLSGIRKKGIDVYVESVKLMSLPLKIKIFSATEKKEDFYKVKKIISEIKEVTELKKTELNKLLIEKKNLEDHVKK